MPSAFAVRAMRHAISPRLAIRTDENIRRFYRKTQDDWNWRAKPKFRPPRRSYCGRGGAVGASGMGAEVAGGPACVRGGRAGRRGGVVGGAAAVAGLSAAGGGAAGALAVGSLVMMFTGGIEAADGNVYR